MASEQIAALMDEFLHRHLELSRSLKTKLANQFFVANSDTQAANMLGFMLGCEPLETAQLECCEKEPLFEPDLYKRYLLPIVKRMPSREFCFLPLVLEHTGQSGTPGLSLLIRVRCGRPHHAKFCYLDLSRRRYTGYPEFVRSNRFPPCTLWCPRNGMISYDACGRIRVSGWKVKKRRGELWKTLTIVGNIGAVALMMAAPEIAPLLVFGITIPITGFSIVDLVDGIRHERNSVIVYRATALATNLMTFASVGLTVACKADRLRRLLTADQLKLLLSAESFLQVANSSMMTTFALVSLVGSVSGFANLSKLEWLLLAANLCLAHRKCLTMEGAKSLIARLELRGIATFFLTTCRNIKLKYQELITLIEPYLDTVLPFVLDVLMQGIEFSVTDDFTEITIFGYRFQFRTLLNVDPKLLKTLFAQLAERAGEMMESVGKCFSQVTSSNSLFGDAPTLLELLQAILELGGRLKALKESADLLINAIRFGRGLEFTRETLLAWWRAPTHDRIGLLRALVALERDQTEQVNQLRSSERLKDEDLFRWLVESGNAMVSHNDESNTHECYTFLLHFLLDVAQRMPSSSVIAFDGDHHIVIDELLAITASEYNSVPTGNRDVLLNDPRFLQLCRDVSPTPGVNLLERAKQTWLRTCSQEHPQFETIGLLVALLGSAEPPLPMPLSRALDIALDEAGYTVGTVYYGILFASHVLRSQADVTASTSTSAIEARFCHLLSVAENHRLANADPTHHRREATSTEDEELLALLNRLNTDGDTDDDRAWHSHDADARAQIGPHDRDTFLFPCLREEDWR
ncbi:uncharacterized protein LOC125951778 [Anopheles darlingi]|uniref:uncharacterized protein LOC125951778 n=1 Tax=Anopheles darlingi TaxID=43151 RepID=UPI0021004E65|nr:uncharacterized protein LOC125951778 [Anopheles darlingi]